MEGICMEKYKSGKMIRLNRLLGRGKTIIVPLDDSLTAGPFDGLLDIGKTLEEINDSKANSILTYKGTFNNNIKVWNKKSGILNLSVSTIYSTTNHKRIINDVEQALIMGFDGVAVHVNITSQYEGKMLEDFGNISRICDYYNMPLLAIMYPRCESDKVINNYENLKRDEPQKYKELVMHCVRIAVEVGADIIKTQYTGDCDSFRDVVAVSEGIPIVIAGSSLVEENIVIKNAKEAVSAGAQGICFGRNIFNRKNPRDLIDKIYSAIN